MVRRSTSPNQARLSVTQLEGREVPAGMIDVIYSPTSGVEIRGDTFANQIRVEHVQASWGYDIQVSSESGPIRFLNSYSGESYITEDPIVVLSGTAAGGGLLTIDTGNGDDTIEVNSTARPNPNAYLDWQSIYILSGYGDDQVLLDDLQAPLNVSTGKGSDLVTLRNCSGHISDNLYSDALIETGSGDDRVVILGTFNYQTSSIWLGAGDDVLEGDSETTLPQGVILIVDGSSGFDQVLNSDYFPEHWAFAGFEEIS